MVVGCAKEKFWAAAVPRSSATRSGPRPARRTRRSPAGERNSAELLPRLEAIFRQQHRRRVAARSSTPASIPCGPINDVGAALRGRAHRRPRTCRRPPSTRATARSRQLASPVRVGDEPPTYRRAPQRNEDLALVTEEILGLDAQQVVALRAAGAFGDAEPAHGATPPTPRRPRHHSHVTMIAEELAEWAHGPRRTCRPRSGPQPLRHLLDGVGTALRALRASPTRRTRRPPAPSRRPRTRRPAGGDDPRARGGRLGAPAAALANGTLVHALDFDDTHAGGLVHATAVVLPAAFAVGEQVGAPGPGRARGRRRRLRDRLPGRRRRAARLPRPRPARHDGGRRVLLGGRRRPGCSASTPRGRPTRSASPAARPAGCSRSCTPEPRRSSCTRDSPRTPASSPPGSPRPGPAGPANVLDGPHGVYDALAAGAVDLASITAELGTRWETTRIGIKPYPACQLSHAAIDAVRDAVRRGGSVPATSPRSTSTCTPTRCPRSATPGGTWRGRRRRTRRSSRCRGASPPPSSTVT